MKEAAAPPTTRAPRGKNASSLGTLGMDLLDTAWRIAVPVLLFAVSGIFADKSFGTAPWITLAATLVGFVVAGWLVKKQLAAVEQEDRQ